MKQSPVTFPVPKLLLPLILSFIICSVPADAENYQWPSQSYDQTAPAKPVQGVPPTVPPAVRQAPPVAQPNPRARLTLEGCLEKVKVMYGKIDESSPEVRECYRSWAGTVDSAIKSYGIVRSTTGPAPCYRRQIVTVKDDGSMNIAVIPNDKVSDCDSPTGKQQRSFRMSPVNIEYFRSLLGMDVLNSLPPRYVDASMNEATSTQWTFILNGKPAKSVEINVPDENVLPLEVRAYLNSFDSIILQTQRQ